MPDFRLRTSLLCLAPLLLLWGCTASHSEPDGPRALDIRGQQEHPLPRPRTELRVATLNIAHGRGDSLNQLLVSTQRTVNNLDGIAEFLQRENIHIVALQEADSASSWSGNFDHAEHLSSAAGYNWWVQESHAELGIASYGTAILSSLPMTAAAGLSFTPSPPTARKGFTVAEIQWLVADGESLVIDVISIHMDFSRKSVREQQLAELSEVMGNRQNPVILMGDFNSETLAAQLMANAAESERKLHTWNGPAEAQYTYKDKRLDWIIISGELDFVDYRAAPAVLSDHRAVIAEIRLNNSDEVE